MKNILKKIISFILALESSLILAKYRPKIIAITGNLGKTSAKDAIYSALTNKLQVRKSEKSFNSEIGVPLTILGCENAWSDVVKWLKVLWRGVEILIFDEDYPDYLVLEIGADHPKDIESITKWLKPDIAVITAIPEIPVHIEFFKSREELVNEKMMLVKALKKGGTLILNQDDETVRKMTAGRNDLNIITYGFSDESEIQAKNFSFEYVVESRTKTLIGSSFEIFDQNNNIGGLNILDGGNNGSLNKFIQKGVVGKQHVYPILSALAVCKTLGISLKLSVEALLKHKPPSGRMNLIKGINKSVIIDDTYNSSPRAVEEALWVLGKVETTGRKIAVLGDMLELGKKSNDVHRDIGQKIFKSADILITVGMRSGRFVEGAKKAGMKKEKIFSFTESTHAGIFLSRFILKKDLILVKGSQGMRMEKIVKEIMQDPKLAKDLLVRQDEEWLGR